MKELRSGRKKEGRRNGVKSWVKEKPRENPTKGLKFKAGNSTFVF